ncbi:MAG: alkaline phosphatase family protein [Deltaproteobacteria bacterium]|nr:alkaline phosphatase family protein [Deltaproteobacteria bacterium]
MPKRFTRRDALKQMGVLAGAAMVAPALDGCGEGAKAPGAIKNLVVLMMENRSYDHFFGSRSLVEGLPSDGLVRGMANPDVNGVMQSIFPVDVECVADPPHGWDPSHAQFNLGKNDGFLRQYQASHGDTVAPHVMGFLLRNDLPVSYALADAYTSCDRWHASVMGPTWPNRFYLHTAQSNGQKSNFQPSTVWPTIFDKLEAAGVSWKYYFSDLPFLATLSVPSSGYKPITSFYDDAKAGTLPQYTVLEPAFQLNDDHPPHHPIMGQQFVASVYNALARSPQWESTLLAIIYDEHGGFFDHVAPPKTDDDRVSEGFDQLGFRIPALLVGPYVKRGHISSVLHDHTSVLKHAETMFGLTPLTRRDAAANDLSDALDLDRMARGEAYAAVPVPVIDVDPNSLDLACASHRNPTDLELWADGGVLESRLDLRRQSRDLAHYIADLARDGL